MAGSALDVALTFDDNYWAPAYAVMRSISLTSERPRDLTFHLIHIGLTERHRADLDAITSEFPVTLRYVDLATEPAYAGLVAGLPIAPPFTPVIYARLLLAELLSTEVERVVYLDCDTLVRAPVERLLATDLEGKAIGAVLDPHRHVLMFGRDLRGNRDVFDYNFPYFNSGVLLINRAAYGAANIPARAREMVASGLMARLHYDQALLNLVFRDNWLPLDFRWNLTTAERAHEVLEPFICHYTGPRKPWGLLPGAAFHRHYRQTMTNDVYDRYWREGLAKPFQRLMRRR